MSVMLNRLIVAALLLSGVVICAPKRGVELWSQKPVVRSPVPAGVTQSTNPIDALIASELKRRGLRPAGPADKPTLLRRVYLDLIGLPPSPAEQNAFLKDDSPDAYEKVVDCLLADRNMGFAMDATGWTFCGMPTWTSGCTPNPVSIFGATGLSTS